MPIQVFKCDIDGDQEILFRNFKTPKTIPCPICTKDISIIISIPALITVKRTWNEQANDFRRNPYEQSKAQLTNMYNESSELGIEVPKVTEEAIQAGAKAIQYDKGKIKKSDKQRQLDRVK